MFISPASFVACRTQPRALEAGAEPRREPLQTRALSPARKGSLETRSVFTYKGAGLTASVGALAALERVLHWPHSGLA